MIILLEERKKVLGGSTAPPIFSKLIGIPGIPEFEFYSKEEESMIWYELNDPSGVPIPKVKAWIEERRKIHEAMTKEE